MKNMKNNKNTVKNSLITVRVNEKHELEFFATINNRKYYLFTQDFSIGQLRYFENGRYLVELYNHRYDVNPRLDKTIERIPKMVSYVSREVACFDQAA